jgi:hypothetical protein
MRTILLSRLFSICLLLAASASMALAQNFRVVKAEYGAGNSWTDVTDRVRNLVRGEGLDFRVDGDSLTDPLPGVPKTLRIRYVLQGEERTDNFEDLSYVRLGNPSPAGQPVPAVQPGTDRPRPNRPIGRPNFPARNRLSIVRAEYGEGQRWRDVTDLLNQQIQGNALRVAVNNTTMGGDPAPAVAKRVRVQYLLNGQQMSVEIAENRELILPVTLSGGSFGQPQAAFEVLEAFYQANGRRNDVTTVLRNATNNDRISLRVNNQTMGGDPVPGPRKELVVRYRFQGTEYEATVREDSTLNLPNSADRVVNAGGAFGGGNSSGGSIFAPPNTQAPVNSSLEIVAARWGAGDRWLDVTNDLQSGVRDGRLSIAARAQSFWGSDPAPGVRKVLQVRYRLNNGSERQVNTNDGSTLNLP